MGRGKVGGKVTHSEGIGGFRADVRVEAAHVTAQASCELDERISDWLAVEKKQQLYARSVQCEV